MGSGDGRYSGYCGYNKSTFNVQDSEHSFSSDKVVEANENSLSKPVMNVDSLFKLANFLDANKASNSFPEITVIPDVLRSVGRFVNERKRMKYSHQEFEAKVKFLSEGVDKQYKIALRKIEQETEVQLAQINGNIEQRILEINRYYDLELQKLAVKYKLKSQEMNLYYENLEAQRREQNKHFNKMIKIARIDAKRANKAIKEAEQVCGFFRRKIYANSATYEERNYYMELLKFRLARVNTVDIIAQLAAKIE